jgi:hypothetical protein
LALPTAICRPPAAAVLLIFNSGTVAPAMPLSEIDRTVPSVPASRKTGCWLILLAAVAPIATTVPPGATVAPDTDATDALPSGPVGSHDVPVLV